jgi:hypothetical protein
VAIVHSEGFEAYDLGPDKPGPCWWRVPDVFRRPAGPFELTPQPANTIRIMAGLDGAAMTLPLLEGATTFLVRKVGGAWLIDYAHQEPIDDPA